MIQISLFHQNGMWTPAIYRRRCQTISKRYVNCCHLSAIIEKTCVACSCLCWSAQEVQMAFAITRFFLFALYAMWWLRVLRTGSSCLFINRRKCAESGRRSGCGGELCYVMLCCFMLVKYDEPVILVSQGSILSSKLKIKGI